MTPRHWHNALLVILALVLTVALTYATVELPRLVSGALVEIVDGGADTIDHNGRHVVAVFAAYGVIAILLSLPFALLDWPHSTQAMLHAFPYDMPPFR